jgi:hypothetical protein
MSSLTRQASRCINLWNMVVFCCDIATGRVRKSRTWVAPGNGIVGRDVAQSPCIWYIGICALPMAVSQRVLAPNISDTGSEVVRLDEYAQNDSGPPQYESSRIRSI